MKKNLNTELPIQNVTDIETETIHKYYKAKK